MRVPEGNHLTNDVAAAPVVRLDPVSLPPPGRDPGRAASLSWRAALSVALLVGVFVLALVLILAGIGLNVLVFRLGRVNVGLVVATVAVVAAVGRALQSAVKTPPEPPDELEVPAEAEPGLHDEVRRLAEQVGTRPPDRVVLIPAVNAYVREFGPLLGLLGGTRTLAIGTPLLDTLTVSQLRAVLAHELGHLAGGDTRLGPLAYRTEQVLADLVGRLHGSLSGRVFAAYWKLQHRVSAKVRRGQELVADRAAVEVAGRQAAADALRVVEVTAVAQDVLNRAYLGPLLETGHRPADLRYGLRQLLRGRAGDLVAHLDEAVGEADPYASHPPTAERILRLAHLPETHVGGTDDRAARALLRDPAAWITTVDDRWLHLVTGGAGLPAVAWSEWPRLVVAEERTARATTVNGVLADLGLPEGLAGVQAAFERGRERELAAALVRAGWRTGGPD
ncbi:MAG: M48 family metallopeptidase, partial [Actinomycetota bacterium]|nr:M48 family metallopeptidase [Actinomycetota bacterium]